MLFDTSRMGVSLLIGAIAALCGVLQAAPAPSALIKSLPNVNHVEGEYIAGNSYRVRYVADERGFHANVVFIGADAGAAKAIAVPPHKPFKTIPVAVKPKTPVAVKPKTPVPVKPVAVRPNPVAVKPKTPVAVKPVAVRPNPVAVKPKTPVAVRPKTPVKPVKTVVVDDDDDDDDDVPVLDLNIRPPVVMSSRPSKIQDADGIGCAIRNSLCGK